jgi:hypothetical protein
MIFNLKLDYIYAPTTSSLHPIALFIALLGLITYSFTHTGIRFCNFLFGAMNVLLKAVLSFGNSPLFTVPQQQLVAQTPSNLRAALSHFSLEGKTEVWAVCPACKYTHKPTYNISTGRNTWPSHCRYQDASGVACRTPLLHQRGKEKIPVSTYLVPCFYDYLGRLLSNPDIETLCNQAIDEARRTGIPDSGSTDVFSSSFVQTLKDCDLKSFLERGDHIRLLFTMHYDQFNPKGVRIRSDSSSVGIFNLALLNLPPALRYLPEHVFMTLFPGPSPPRGAELNHFMRPIVESLVIAWERGVKLSRTALCEHGAVVDAAVAYITADLVAARHIAGLASPTSNWLCSTCGLYGRQKVWDVDWAGWPLRNRDDMEKVAQSWRDASSEQSREKIWQEHGIRWSELWLLPYFNPTKMLVVDAMHCLLLGLVQYYCRHVLHLHEDTDLQAKPTAFDWDWEEYNENDCDPRYAIAEKDVKMVSSIHRLLQRVIDEEFTLDMLSSRLSNRNMAPLKFVVHSLDIPEVVIRGSGTHAHNLPATTKSHFVDLLVTWVRSCPLSRNDTNDPYSAGPNQWIDPRTLLLPLLLALHSHIFNESFERLPLPLGSTRCRRTLVKNRQGP